MSKKLYGFLRSVWEELVDLEFTNSLSGKFYNLEFGSNKVYIGVDGENCPHLLISGLRKHLLKSDFNFQGLSFSFEFFDIEGVKSEFLDITLASDHRNLYFDVFSVFCEDIIYSIDKEGASNPEEIINKQIHKWHKFWKPVKSPLVDQQWLKGLMGELLFLKQIIKLNEGFLRSWVGPCGSDQDFCFEKPFAVEVKSSSSKANKVSISNIHQLDYTRLKELYLYVFKLKKTHTDDAFSLTDLVNDIESSIDTISLNDVFWSKLEASGYNPLFCEFYDQHLFAIESEHLYEVNEDFPLVIPSSFASGISNLIQNLKYDVILPDKEIELEELLHKIGKCHTES